MTITLTNDEASLLAYACKELAYKRTEQAVEGRKHNSEFANANENEARQLFGLSRRLTEGTS